MAKKTGDAKTGDAQNKFENATKALERNPIFIALAPTMFPSLSAGSYLTSDLPDPLAAKPNHRDFLTIRDGEIRSKFLLLKKFFEAFVTNRKEGQKIASDIKNDPSETDARLSALQYLYNLAESYPHAAILDETTVCGNNKSGIASSLFGGVGSSSLRDVLNEFARYASNIGVKRLNGRAVDTLKIKKGEDLSEAVYEEQKKDFNKKLLSVKECKGQFIVGGGADREINRPAQSQLSEEVLDRAVDELRSFTAQHSSLASSPSPAPEVVTAPTRSPEPAPVVQSAANASPAGLVATPPWSSEVVTSPTSALPDNVPTEPAAASAPAVQPAVPASESRPTNAQIVARSSTPSADQLTNRGLVVEQQTHDTPLAQRLGTLMLTINNLPTPMAQAYVLLNVWNQLALAPKVVEVQVAQKMIQVELARVVPQLPAQEQSRIAGLLADAPAPAQSAMVTTKAAEPAQVNMQDIIRRLLEDRVLRENILRQAPTIIPPALMHNLTQQFAELSTQLGSAQRGGAIADATPVPTPQPTAHVVTPQAAAPTPSAPARAAAPTSPASAPVVPAASGSGEATLGTSSEASEPVFKNDEENRWFANLASIATKMEQDLSFDKVQQKKLYTAMVEDNEEEMRVLGNQPKRFTQEDKVRLDELLKQQNFRLLYEQHHSNPRVSDVLDKITSSYDLMHELEGIDPPSSVMLMMASRDKLVSRVFINSSEATIAAKMCLRRLQIAWEQDDKDTIKDLVQWRPFVELHGFYARLGSRDPLKSSLAEALRDVGNMFTEQEIEGIESNYVKEKLRMLKKIELKPSTGASIMRNSTAVASPLTGDRKDAVKFSTAIGNAIAQKALYRKLLRSHDVASVHDAAPAPIVRPAAAPAPIPPAPPALPPLPIELYPDSAPTEPAAASVAAHIPSDDELRYSAPESLVTKSATPSSPIPQPTAPVAVPQAAAIPVSPATVVEGVSAAAAPAPIASSRPARPRVLNTKDLAVSERAQIVQAKSPSGVIIDKEKLRALAKAADSLRRIAVRDETTTNAISSTINTLKGFRPNSDMLNSIVLLRMKQDQLTNYTSATLIPFMDAVDVALGSIGLSMKWSTALQNKRSTWLAAPVEVVETRGDKRGQDVQPEEVLHRSKKQRVVESAEQTKAQEHKTAERGSSAETRPAASEHEQIVTRVVGSALTGNAASAPAVDSRPAAPAPLPVAGGAPATPSTPPMVDKKSLARDVGAELAALNRGTQMDSTEVAQDTQILSTSPQPKPNRTTKQEENMPSRINSRQKSNQALWNEMVNGVHPDDKSSGLHVPTARASSPAAVSITPPPSSNTAFASPAAGLGAGEVTPVPVATFSPDTASPQDGVMNTKGTDDLTEVSLENRQAAWSKMKIPVGVHESYVRHFGNIFTSRSYNISQLKATMNDLLSQQTMVNALHSVRNSAKKVFQLLHQMLPGNRVAQELAQLNETAPQVDVTHEQAIPAVASAPVAKTGPMQRAADVAASAAKAAGNAVSGVGRAVGAAASSVFSRGAAKPQPQAPASTPREMGMLHVPPKPKAAELRQANPGGIEMQTMQNTDRSTRSRSSSAGSVDTTASTASNASFRTVKSGSVDSTASRTVDSREVEMSEMGSTRSRRGSFNSVGSAVSTASNTSFYSTRSRASSMDSITSTSSYEEDSKADPRPAAHSPQEAEMARLAAGPDHPNAFGDSKSDSDGESVASSDGPSLLQRMGNAIAAAPKMAMNAMTRNAGAAQSEQSQALAARQASVAQSMATVAVLNQEIDEREVALKVQIRNVMAEELYKLAEQGEDYRKVEANKLVEAVQSRLGVLASDKTMARYAHDLAKNHRFEMMCEVAAQLIVKQSRVEILPGDKLAMVAKYAAALQEIGAKKLDDFHCLYMQGEAREAKMLHASGILAYKLEYLSMPQAKFVNTLSGGLNALVIGSKNIAQALAKDAAEQKKAVAALEAKAQKKVIASATTKKNLQSLAQTVRDAPMKERVRNVMSDVLYRAAEGGMDYRNVDNDLLREQTLSSFINKHGDLVGKQRTQISSYVEQLLKPEGRFRLMCYATATQAVKYSGLFERASEVQKEAAILKYTADLEKIGAIKLDDFRCAGKQAATSGVQPNIGMLHSFMLSSYTEIDAGGETHKIGINIQNLVIGTKNIEKEVVNARVRNHKEEFEQAKIRLRDAIGKMLYETSNDYRKLIQQEFINKCKEVSCPAEYKLQLQSYAEQLAKPNERFKLMCRAVAHRVGGHLNPNNTRRYTDALVKIGPNDLGDFRCVFKRNITIPGGALPHRLGEDVMDLPDLGSNTVNNIRNNFKANMIIGEENIARAYAEKAAEMAMEQVKTFLEGINQEYGYQVSSKDFAKMQKMYAEQLMDKYRNNEFRIEDLANNKSALIKGFALIVAGKMVEHCRKTAQLVPFKANDQELTMMVKTSLATIKKRDVNAVETKIGVADTSLNIPDQALLVASANIRNSTRDNIKRASLAIDVMIVDTIRISKNASQFYLDSKVRHHIMQYMLNNPQMDYLAFTDAMRKQIEQRKDVDKKHTFAMFDSKAKVVRDASGHYTKSSVLNAAHRLRRTAENLGFGGISSTEGLDRYIALAANSANNGEQIFVAYSFPKRDLEAISSDVRGKLLVDEVKFSDKIWNQLMVDLAKTLEEARLSGKRMSIGDIKDKLFYALTGIYSGGSVEKESGVVTAVPSSFFEEVLKYRKKSGLSLNEILNNGTKLSENMRERDEKLRNEIANTDLSNLIGKWDDEQRAKEKPAAIKIQAVTRGHAARKVAKAQKDKDLVESKGTDEVSVTDPHATTGVGLNKSLLQKLKGMVLGASSPEFPVSSDAPVSATRKDNNKSRGHD